VLEKYPEITVSDPLWLSYADGDWTQIVPTMDDVALLVNVIHHCDVVVNVASTMAMDFAILGKPGIYIAYNPPSINGNWSIHDLYRLPHFRSVHDLHPVYWAYGSEELGTLVMHALSHPQEKSQARSDWLNKQVMQPLNEASARCQKALCNIAFNKVNALTKKDAILACPC
jgi:hypothetical protein